MIENILLVLGILLFATVSFLKLKMFAPRKCPKCGKISISTPPKINTNLADTSFVCLKCKHTWYVDYTRSWWKLFSKKK